MRIITKIARLFWPFSTGVSEVARKAVRCVLNIKAAIGMTIKGTSALSVSMQCPNTALEVVGMGVQPALRIISMTYKPAIEANLR